MNKIEVNKELKTPKAFYLKVHGRVLEHLGIQMYQSPVNALSELVANAWDADAEIVEITLPESLESDSVITIQDTGKGMTAEECQDKYLHVGWNRRGEDPDAKTKKNRHVLGRKGIGKFAGFGIADVIHVETVSKETGEKTVFELDINNLIGKDYIGKDDKEIPILKYEPPDSSKAEHHGTKIILKHLKLKKAISLTQFPLSMARRYLLHQRVDDFKIIVNSNPLPEALSLEKIQYTFPRDYNTNDKPAGITAVDDKTGWGDEQLPNNKHIKWRFMFHRETIEEEELRGITIFSKGKIAQAPFLFGITGGLGGQHGVEYLTGQVEAYYLDSMKEDLAATERQRINWSHPEAEVLLNWGEKRVKQALKLWKEKRSEKRVKQIQEKVSGFANRLGKLPKAEARTVTKALKKLAQIETLNDEIFQEIGSAILTAWEQGRLRELIDHIAETEIESEADVLKTLAEADIITALNIAEAVKTKLELVSGLKKRIKEKELENAIRDYISKNPWLISPKLETYKVEKSLKEIVKNAAIKARLQKGKELSRVDLVLSSGDSIVVLEFMRPGLKLDIDHLIRFEIYFRAIKMNLSAITGSDFKFHLGYVIADKLESDPTMVDKLKSMAKDDMFAMEHTCSSCSLRIGRIPGRLSKQRTPRRTT